ncbi:MAG: hypothetical protein KF853_07180 [Rhodocyclaceae bacterium]|nr:hypothetical protein [Rhodocyclaceae bacterium]MBX3676787.1 hypothetical protein [Rhodocyclaceae bacterium]MCB1891637.1 hypothetical protein [Rhodocyclaceae bacterium]MCP5296992.1 hypothetical protein [Zoogloeaceae bacterium]MCW5594413.1 hypothetical protein [Rhodocyclaceae bacterium]
MSAASKTVDEPAEEAAPPPGLALRAKRLLIAPLLLLGRLRQSKASETDEEAEDVPPDPRNARRSEADEAEAAPAAPPWWRRLLPYGLVLLAGIVAGGGGIYWLSAQIISHQAAALTEQDDEIARLKGVLAGYDRLMLENHRKLEAEKGKRAELGNRLAIAQSDLTRRTPPEDDHGTDATGHAVPGKGLDCTLRAGSISGTLKACLKEFNRK